MEDGLGQVDVAKVSRALRHGAGAGLTPGGPVNGALARVHQAAQLRASALVGLGIPDAPLGDAHPAYLLRAQDSELDPLHLAHRRLTVRRIDTHFHFFTRSICKNNRYGTSQEIKLVRDVIDV